MSSQKQQHSSATADLSESAPHATDAAHLRADRSKKPGEVAAMFDVVAQRYDLTNDVISLGQVYVWRRVARRALEPKPGQTILDVAGGTGASSLPLVRAGAHVIVADISEGMLAVGRSRHPEVEFIWGSATDLPFEDDVFDAVTISFGIRNVEDVPLALREMYRVTKPGGRIVICEFSTPIPVARTAHNFYLKAVAPTVARLASPAGAAYDYLSESILEWHDQDTLGKMMLDAGWEDVSYRNLTYGAVAVHRGFKGEGARPAPTSVEG